MYKNYTKTAYAAFRYFCAYSEDRTRRGVEYPETDTAPLIKSEDWDDFTRLTKVLQAISERSRGVRTPGVDSGVLYM